VAGVGIENGLGGLQAAKTHGRASAARSSSCRDMLRIAVLPYLHPRAFSRLTAKPFFMMTDEELEETRRAELEHERQVSLGRGHLHLMKGPK